MPNTIPSKMPVWLVLLLAAFIGATAYGQASSPILDSDTTTIRRPDSYGKPNQSRLWYNSLQNRWDGLIPKNDAEQVFSQSDHYIMKDIPGAQTFTEVELEDRDFARPDVFWDDDGGKLYVFSSHPVSAEFWRLGYDALSDSYAIEVGAVGEGVVVPGITHPNNGFGGNTPASVYVSPNGRVWAAVMKNSGLRIQHSADGGMTWLAAPIKLNGDARLGVTTWIDFEDRGTTFVGVFGTENGEDNSPTFFFFYFIDQEDDPSLLSNWVDDSANIPGPVGREQADDHVSAARDVAGNLYFAVKTEGGDPTDPLIKLFKRTPPGQWSVFKVTETQEVPEESRPSLVIDEENSELYIYTNGAEIVSQTEREGSRVKAPLESLEELETAPLVTLFGEPDVIFTDLITPRQRVDASSGIVVMAHNRTEDTLWFATEEIAASTVTVPRVVGLTQARAETAIGSAGLTTGRVSTAFSETVAAGNVISQRPEAGRAAEREAAVDLVISSGTAIIFRDNFDVE